MSNAAKEAALRLIEEIQSDQTTQQFKPDDRLFQSVRNVFIVVFNNKGWKIIREGWKLWIWSRFSGAARSL